MARPLRIQYPDAYYHVTCRGNARRDIFYDDRDYALFLERLSLSLTTYDVLLLAVSGHLKPATKERFKTGHFEGEVSPVEYLLTEGGSTDGEPDQSGTTELDIDTS